MKVESNSHPGARTAPPAAPDRAARTITAAPGWGGGVSTPPQPQYNGNGARWTPAMIALLRVGAAQKLSAADIARKVGDLAGFRLSKNSVIGKAAREGIPLRGKRGRLFGSKTAAPKPQAQRQPSPPMPLKQPRPQLPEPKPYNAHHFASPAKMIARPAEPKASPVVAAPAPAAITPVLRDDGQPHTLLSLPHRACRWPIGGGGRNMQFCAHSTPLDTPWCAAHEVLAWQPKRQKEAAQ